MGRRRRDIREVRRLLSGAANGGPGRERKPIFVETGRLRSAAGDAVLCARALGSCVAVVVWDSRLRCGGIAHVLLPGFPLLKDRKNRHRYAATAICDLLVRMNRRGSRRETWKVFLIGGGNVLRRKDDSICDDIIRSVRCVLGESGLKPHAEVLGGTEWKSVLLDVATGRLWYRTGLTREKLICLGADE